MSISDGSNLSEDQKSELFEYKKSEIKMFEGEQSEMNNIENRKSETKMIQHKKSQLDLSVCQCINLTLSDGRKSDCANVWNPNFCFVKTSPCVVLDDSGTILEYSIPDPKTNGLLHFSYLACQN
jgi:hypothetical protein